jgi:histidyl-tRNA synthetase
MNEETAKSDNQNLSTEPYKGVRDFYPEDMFIENYIFSIMRKTVESYGYLEYGASILEPTELYKAKSGDEIVNEQTYSFKDRGDREVTLRQEITPTIARMVAARKKELAFPLRWYSIPNLFRYEKPQRGRIREFFQLNVDIFGIDSVQADLEAIEMAASLMKNFGAQDSQYKILVNNRKILNYLLEQVFALKQEVTYKVMKLIDKKNKLSPHEFSEEAKKLLGDHAGLFTSLLNTKSVDEFSRLVAEKTSSEVLGAKETTELMSTLEKVNIKNAVFDPTLVRGADYYTGIVFEVFDVNPENPRAIFGGGRYDDLLSVFGSDKVPAVGFGMGDLVIKDFLETYKLLPAFSSKIHLAICLLNADVIPFANTFALELRSLGLNVSIDITGKKLAQQIQSATRQSIPYIIVIGENEVKDKKYTIKELETGKENVFTSVKEIAEFVKKH